MVNVDRFQFGEEEALRDVYYSAIRLVCIDDYTPEQLQAWAPDDFDQEVWKKRIRRINPYVAKIGSRIVGYADLQADGYIDHFFVHGHYQSKGVGGSLMKALLEEGRFLKKMYSHVSVTARPFFEHYGFKFVREQIFEMRSCKINNYVMERINEKL